MPSFDSGTQLLLNHLTIAALQFSAGSYSIMAVSTRNAVEDIWGERKPYKHVWPDRVDQVTIEDPEKWVQAACVMCRLHNLGCCP